MKTPLATLWWLALVSSPLALSAQAVAHQSPAAIVSPIQHENDLLALAHTAAQADDDSTVESQLFVPSTLPEAPAPSILLARRAMALCGRLQNEDEYARASRLAVRVLAKLATLKEITDTAREERLYWEACLEAQILDHKVRAIALLRAAEKLAPDDSRVTDLELPLVAAVNSFGH